MCRHRPCHPGRGGQGEARSFPCRHHRRQGLGGGGAPSAPVAGRGGSNGRGSSGGDNDLFCCGMWLDVVFLVWWQCELHAVRMGVHDVVCGWDRTGWHENDGITLSITNAGANCPTF